MGAVGLDWADGRKTTADIMRSEDIGVRRGLVFRWGDGEIPGKGGCIHSAFIMAWDMK